MPDKRLVKGCGKSCLRCLHANKFAKSKWHISMGIIEGELKDNLWPSLEKRAKRRKRKREHLQIAQRREENIKKGNMRLESN